MVSDFNVIDHILEEKSCKRRLTFLSPSEEKEVPKKRRQKLTSHVAMPKHIIMYIASLLILCNFIALFSSNVACDAEVS